MTQATFDTNEYRVAYNDSISLEQDHIIDKENIFPMFV